MKAYWTSMDHHHAKRSIVRKIDSENDNTLTLDDGGDAGDATSAGATLAGGPRCVGARAGAACGADHAGDAAALSSSRRTFRHASQQTFTRRSNSINSRRWFVGIVARLHNDAHNVREGTRNNDDSFKGRSHLDENARSGFDEQRQRVVLLRVAVGEKLGAVDDLCACACAHDTTRHDTTTAAKNAAVASVLELVGKSRWLNAAAAAAAASDRRHELARRGASCCDDQHAPAL